MNSIGNRRALHSLSNGFSADICLLRRDEFWYVRVCPCHCCRSTPPGVHENNGALFCSAAFHSTRQRQLCAAGRIHSPLLSKSSLQNPAFGPAQIRGVTDIFVEKARQLRDIWQAEVASGNGDSAPLDVVAGLNNMTLDVIGLAGKLEAELWRLYYPLLTCVFRIQL